MYFAEEDAVEYFSSGAQVIDNILGGGWAVGRTINIVGDKSTGKTLLALEACANLLLKYPDSKVYYADCEAAFDISYITSLGIPLSKIEQPAHKLYSIEDFANGLDTIINSFPSKSHGIYVLDSLDALSSEAELAKNIDEGSYGADKPKKLGEFFRRYNQKMESKNITLIIISQIRDVITSSFPMSKRSGGKALDFYAGQVLWLSDKGKIEKTIDKVKRPVGLDIKAKCTKNKVGTPFRECNFKLMFGYGVDDIRSNMEFLEEIDCLKKVQMDGHPILNTDSAHKKALALPPEERQKFRAELAAVTKAEWDAIELKFKPTMTKY